MIRMHEAILRTLQSSFSLSSDHTLILDELIFQSDNNARVGPEQSNTRKHMIKNLCVYLSPYVTLSNCIGTKNKKKKFQLVPQP